MAEQSRTSKSLKNIAVALLFLAVNLLLQFFCRDVFLERLGAEVLGLNTTAGNLLQFLNIAELGIGVAVGFSLYKPLFDKDTQRINEIISLQGHMYRRIALIVIAGAVVLGAFFPFIFSKMKLPLWYAYASFGVLLVSALLSYFVNYKEVLLSADQKEYKITYSYKACMMARLIVQYFIIKNCENPYIWWLVLEGGFAVIASIALSAMVRRTYPFLKTGISTSAELKKKYPEIVTKIKQIFFHKISTFVLQQTSPLIIYAFASLTLVTYYTNYTRIGTPPQRTFQFHRSRCGKPCSLRRQAKDNERFRRTVLSTILHQRGGFNSSVHTHTVIHNSLDRGAIHSSTVHPCNHLLHSFPQCLENIRRLLHKCIRTFPRRMGTDCGSVSESRSFRSFRMDMGTQRHTDGRCGQPVADCFPLETVLPFPLGSQGADRHLHTPVYAPHSGNIRHIIHHLDY